MAEFVVEAEKAAKSANANQKQLERIAAVNNWRGQCLDSFARVEMAILQASEQLLAMDTTHPFALQESAGNRTRTLAIALRENWPKTRESIRTAGLLEQWAIREKERNQLVHGRFTIKPAPASDWLLINDFMTVKKGVCISGRSMLDARQAEAFLKQVKAERKQLEEALNSVHTALVKPA